MKFIRYPKLMNGDSKDVIDNIKLIYPRACDTYRWSVTEQIKGVQYSFYADKDEVIVANKKDFIGFAQAYYKHERIFDRYCEEIHHMAENMPAPIVVYGELFGGYYKNLPKDPNAIPVDTSISYHSDNDWLCYDIAEIIDGKLVFFGIDKFLELTLKYKIPTVPIIHIGKLADCVKYDLEHDSVIPLLYTNPDVVNNTLKGIVIRPELRLYTTIGDRVIFKRLSQKYKDSIDNKKIVELTPELQKVTDSLKEYLTEDKLCAILPKIKNDLRYSTIMQTFLKEAIADWDSIYYSKLSPQEQRLVNKACNGIMGPMIRKTVLNG